MFLGINTQINRPVTYNYLLITTEVMGFGDCGRISCRNSDKGNAGAKTAKSILAESTQTCVMRLGVYFIRFSSFFFFQYWRWNSRKITIIIWIINCSWIKIYFFNKFIALNFRLYFFNIIRFVKQLNIVN